MPFRASGGFSILLSSCVYIGAISWKLGFSHRICVLPGGNPSIIIPQSSLVLPVDSASHKYRHPPTLMAQGLPPSNTIVRWQRLRPHKQTPHIGLRQTLISEGLVDPGTNASPQGYYS
ncbi:hypothetical protein C8Q73DRAFT_343957 [Cubamyces lactineus]|nr:hypothetical protein C8Q73DRAFT_343957 [Cubamyces lactineus]